MLKLNRSFRNSRAPRRVLGSLVCLALLTANVGTSGCYRRVVSAKGLGADQYDVSESYQANSKVDDWLFGQQKRTDGKRAGSRLPANPTE